MVPIRVFIQSRRLKRSGQEPGQMETGCGVQTCSRVAVSGSMTRRRSRLSCRTLRPARPRANTNE